ncbi:MAG: hypothetical protein EBW55_02425 [Betaproteobacteria bacterium]|nr:hypothetical protein [Betaproteobacteria bacterium]
MAFFLPWRALQVEFVGPMLAACALRLRRPQSASPARWFPLVCLSLIVFPSLFGYFRVATGKTSPVKTFAPCCLLPE